jgi:hypothetical protein
LELVGSKDCTEVVEGMVGEVESEGTVNLWAGRLRGKMTKIAKSFTQFLPGAMEAEIIGLNKTLGRIRGGHKPNGPAYGKLIHKVVKNESRGYE